MFICPKNKQLVSITGKERKSVTTKSQIENYFYFLHKVR
jgi:hypothetical protein